MNARKKALVIGMDCVPPELVLEQWRDSLPNFRRVNE
jgi:predicted AlkP superfamily phosphohydrolase/phosphomutase